MGTTSFRRPAEEEEVDGKVVTKRVSWKRDISGQLVRFVEFVEDDDNQSVSVRTVGSEVFNEAVSNSVDSSANLVVEDLSAQIEGGSPGPYSLSNNPKESSLSVYLNGQLINDQISISNSKDILISNDLSEAIDLDSSIFAIYVEEV